MIKNDKIKTWRDDPITSAQLSAIMNKSEKFHITVSPVPKTKGEAVELIKELDLTILQIRTERFNHWAEGNEDDIY